MAHIEEKWAQDTIEQELFDGIYTDTDEVGDVFPWGKGQALTFCATVGMRVHGL